MSTAHVRNYQYHHPTVRQYPSLCPSSSGTAPSRAAISEPARRQSLPSRSAVSSTPHKFPSWRSHPQSSEVYCSAQSGSYCCPKWKLLLPKVEVTAAQSGSYCCPKWKLLLPKVEVRCLSAARLESANLNTLPKWKGAIIKSICSQSLNCGAHQRAAHYHNCGAHQRALIAEPIKELLIITLLVRLHHLGDQRVALRDRPPVASLERRLEELSEGAI